MSQVDHKHVIKLHGVVTAGKPMMLVLEYAQNNSLERFLKSSSGIVDLTTLAKMRAAADVADGMSHLEDVSVCIECECACDCIKILTSFFYRIYRLESFTEILPREIFC